NLKNYIWKAELQTNANIHFHLIIDQYIHYHAIRHYWNLAIEPLGYIDAYQKKFSAMSLREYAAYRKLSVQDALPGFTFGCRTNWRKPGTENVQAISNRSQIGSYLAKYITKEAKDAKEVTNDDAKRIKEFGRTWAR